MARKIDVSKFDEKAAIEMMGGAPVALSRPAAQVAAAPPKADAKEVLPEQKKEAAQAEHDSTPAQDSESIGRVVEKRRKQYDEVFLVEKRIKIRAMLSVDIETSRKLERVLRMVFDNGITMSSFVDNILNHHLDKYEDYFKQRLASKPQELY
jgi:hypothetical protein